MIETNPFPYFLPPGADKLIIGSFPCYNGSNYGDWFYSGSGKNHFWKLLSDVFFMQAETQQQKIALCKKNKIALTDIGYKIRRLKGNCSDANLEIIKFNTVGIDNCLSKGIKKIFFTSRFVEKHFLKNYPASTIPTYVLISPSPTANKHIGGLKTYKDMLLEKKIKSTYDYRLLKYKELLG